MKSFYEIAKDIITNPKYQELKKYIQHGETSVYSHSIRVAYMCYEKARNDKRVNIESLVKGALLHDYFCYDWHAPRSETKRKGLHGYTHPIVALEKAKKEFGLTLKEMNMIRSHMWPLTLFHMPLSKEAWLLCYCDKVSSIQETAGKRMKFNFSIENI